MNRRDRLLLFGGLVLVLALVNITVAGNERLRRSGTMVLLSLAPRDPRSLMQGDYMALTYAIESEIAARTGNDLLKGPGLLFVRRDARGVATFSRLADAGARPGPDEWPLRFRRRGDGVWVAPDAYHFQEGRADHFAKGRFAELRVDEHGAALLVGLRDAELGAL